MIGNSECEWDSLTEELGRMVWLCCSSKKQSIFPENYLFGHYFKNKIYILAVLHVQKNYKVSIDLP